MFDNSSNTNAHAGHIFGDATAGLDLDSPPAISPFHRELAARLNELQIVGCNRCVTHPSASTDICTDGMYSAKLHGRHSA